MTCPNRNCWSIVCDEFIVSLFFFFFFLNEETKSLVYLRLALFLKKYFSDIGKTNNTRHDLSNISLYVKNNLPFKKTVH